MAVQVMAEDGIDISHQQSTLIDPEFFAGADLVVTLCGDAQDRCPTIPQGTHHLHWDLPDAAQAHGDQAAILEMFRTVRDQIKQEIQTLAD
ncbi:hypothetical protein FC34_GL000100 [Lacticaseibacillus brantae DSM 23927]|uniref:Phosphotyrosine protein phosphatase I domain-containing protein n=2 Tax=Lacticaseibacillus brantae TaxID=943673 RepID=A0A0R2AYG4_9LACO|nr:hypothetical protein FC34_GL000100 [Lacticaseibacillus brantae DSM 23927]